MSVTRCDTQDRVRAVVGQKNITELKLAEDTLQHQRETLDQREKLAAMSGLLASMAHELNNPLAVIMLQSELLLEATVDMPLAERATDINHAAERCVRIVRNFLRLAHQTAPEHTRVQLNSVIADDESWALRYMVVDTRNWWPGKHVLVPPQWTESVRWPQSSVVVGLLRETIKKCAEYDPSTLLNQAYETRLPQSL